LVQTRALHIRQHVIVDQISNAVTTTYCRPASHPANVHVSVSRMVINYKKVGTQFDKLSRPPNVPDLRRTAFIRISHIVD
jgi:hypothetical protein